MNRTGFFLHRIQDRARTMVSTDTAQQPSDNTQAATAPGQPIFLCYRQIDGKPHTRWVYSALKDLLAKKGDPTDVYFDQTAPAVTDWKSIHGAALERACCLVVVCTPGLLADQGENDWVHRELDWWLANREAAPIIVDAIGEGDRWVPLKVKQRWPGSQRVLLDRELWPLASGDELREIRSEIAQQILDGVSGSRFEVARQDLERSRVTNRRLKCLNILLGIFLALIAALVFWAWTASRTARQQKLQALKTLEWVVAETVHFPAEGFDIRHLTPEAQNVLRGLVQRLGELSFRGRLTIYGHVGKFCVAPCSIQPKGCKLRAAPSDLPIRDCVWWPKDEVARGQALQMSAVLREFLQSLPHSPDLDLQVAEVEFQTPLYPYPKEGVAADWNKVAELNTGIRIRLEGE